MNRFRNRKYKNKHPHGRYKLEKRDSRIYMFLFTIFTPRLSSKKRGEERRGKERKGAERRGKEVRGGKRRGEEGEENVNNR